MATDLTVDEKLSAAFMAAYRAYPYFASGLVLLVRRVVEFPEASMAVTRDGILLVDPRFVTEWEVVQLGEVLVHELQHLLRDHAGRSDVVPAVDRFRWNVAADCEINCGLQRDKLPGDPCLPAKFRLPDGLLAEEYYERLPKQVKAAGGVASGACGSGSGGERMDVEPDEGGQDGRTEVEVRLMRSEVAEAVVRASRSRGCVPAVLLRWAEGQLRPPRVRWQDKLGRVVRADVAGAAGKVDYVRNRPNRRQAAYAAMARRFGAGVPILPALRGVKPRVVVVVDTSGSMGQEELEVAMSELSGILRAAGAEVALVSCDCDVAGTPARIRSVADAVKRLRGGGGTDFRPAFTAVEKLRPRPGLVVYVTDGQGTAPERAPEGFKVIWVLVGRYAQEAAEWGESIFVREENEDGQGRSAGR